MKWISYFFLGIALWTMCGSCQNSRTAGAAGQAVSFQDFVKLFPVIQTPFSWDRDSLEKDFPDSLSLDRKSLDPYLADSLWGVSPGKKTAAVHLYPVGRIRNEDHLKLLILQTVTPETRRALLLVYGEADTLISVLQVASVSRQSSRDVFSLSLDNQYLVHINERKALDGGQVILREQVYNINPDGSIQLILTNTNQPASAGSYVNPIDTLAAIDVHSGDYKSGPSGLVSIRDGKTASECRFYIHLDENGGDCTGELEGVARFTGKNIAEFTQEDGPCAVRFTFSRNQVVIKETGGCGAYRGVGCYFDGRYRKGAAQKSGTHKKS